MTYEQTIDYLYTQLPMYGRIGAAAYKKDLINITRLCNELGNPENKFKSIHVAGTNGKGSTSHMLASIFQEAGYKVGLYTSPHIKDFRERIRINGEMIDRDFITEFVERTRELSNAINPSFFELSVALAFEYFATQAVDVVIIETGLGGRLDSTNIISPVLSVITNIGYDHVSILGDTLPEIATEKAGIIKLNTPVVIGEILPETLPVFVNKANEMTAPIYFAQERFMTQYIEPVGSLLLCNMRNTNTGLVEKLRLDLVGIYQTKNVCTVLTAIEILNKLGYNIPEDALHKGLENVKKNTGLAGRWDILQSRPTVIMDVAHNENGISEILAQLNTNHSSSEQHFVLGFVNDKDVTKLLSLFPKQSKYYFTNAHIPRAMPCKELQKAGHILSLKGESFDHVNDAIIAAKTASGENDIIMVCGSFFIIAEVEQPSE